MFNDSKIKVLKSCLLSISFTIDSVTCEMASDKKIPIELENALQAAKYNGHSSAKCSPREVMENAKEKAMYDEIFGPLTVAGRRNSKPNNLLDDYKTNKIPPYSSSSSNNNPLLISNPSDFNTTILTRLKLVEEEAKELKKKYAEEISKNRKLESDIHSL